MSANKTPTPAQFMSLLEDARAKGVTREQIQENGQLFSQLFDTIRLGKCAAVLPIRPPTRTGRICFFVNVPVRLDMPWQQAISEVEFGVTDADDQRARLVGKEYLPSPPSKKEAKANIVLACLDNGWEAIERWADLYRFKPASPRDVFALPKFLSNLYAALRPPRYENESWCSVLSPVPCANGGEVLLCELVAERHGRFLVRLCPMEDTLKGKEDHRWLAYLR